MIDQACTMCANDNLELACAFVQKTATEKAIVEVDKYLKSVSNLCFLLKIIVYKLIKGTSCALIMHYVYLLLLFYL